MSVVDRRDVEAGTRPSSDGSMSARRRQRAGPSPLLVDPLTGKIMQKLASGIGLAAEAYHHHKEKKRQAARAADVQDDDPPPAYQEFDQANRGDEYDGYDDYYSSDIPQQMHEATWQLDEAQDQLSCQAHADAGDDVQPSQLADTFLRGCPTTAESTGARSLALPVLITQRRPGKRSRGFVRAYAPLLEDVGIDQTKFLDFIDKLNKAVQPNGLIQALNLASLAGLAAPDCIGFAISVAIQVATNIGDEVHSRVKTNGFLDKLNEAFFAPRGLVAVVMTWAPNQADEIITMASFDSSVGSATSNSDATGFRKLKHRFDQSNGISSLEWPETAPLIFPSLDEIAEEKRQPKKQNALKRSSHFVEEYMDRRARAKWAGDNPQSIMAKAGSNETFYSRYSDPNNPASSGDPLALVTGGHLKLPSLSLAGRLASPRGGRDGQTVSSAGRSSSSMGGLRKAASSALPWISGGLTLLRKDVLYLMIVNRPTEEQLAEASALLRSA